MASAIEPLPSSLHRATGTTAALELLGCRRTWPGRIAFDLRYSGADQAAELALDLGLYWGDVGEGDQVLVSVTGPGELSVTVPLGESVTRDGSMSLGQPTYDGSSCRVVSWDGGSVEGDGIHTPVNDLQRPDFAAYPADDARALLAAATTADVASRPALALLAGAADPPIVDGLWMLPRELPARIELVAEGPCRWAMLVYNGLTVLQGRGCGNATQLASRATRRSVGFSIAAPGALIALPGGPWTAAAAGPDDARANLAWHTLGRGPELTGNDPGYDPTAELTAFYATHPELTELGRLDFQNGYVTVAVAATGTDLLLAEHPRLETPRPWPGDAPLTRAAMLNCKTAVAHAQTTATTGFAYVAADSPAAQAQLNVAGVWHDLPTTTTGTRNFAATELGPGDWTGPLFRLLDANGTQIRCTSFAIAGGGSEHLLDGDDPPGPPANN